MLRFFYTLCFYLALPVILLRLLYKSRHNHGYRRRWRERFGYIPTPAKTGGIWVHTVSVGETIAAIPLIKQLQAFYPDKLVIMTCMTPTGSERITALFKESVFHVYSPYDTPGAIKRFLRRVQPSLLIIMETELWPNMLHVCAKQHIPIVLANARLSERSYQGYAKIKSLAKHMMQDMTCIAAQAQPDAQRFIQLGADPAKVHVTGSIKFDISIAADIPEKAVALRQQLGVQRPVWIAASTHEGEEESVLAAFQQIRQRVPDVLLVLVPRHPERFAKVAALCEKHGYNVVKRTAQQPCTPTTDIYLGDTMGELLLLYAASDVAYIGGSFVPVGGHNMLEPAVLGVPSITGPHYFNFFTIVPLLENAGGLKKVANIDELAAVVIEWLTDTSSASYAGEQARLTVAAHRGALAAHMEMIQSRVC